jgi:hypothetical protein
MGCEGGPQRQGSESLELGKASFVTASGGLSAITLEAAV